MSPLAPGLIARNGRLASPCDPVPTYSEPSTANGDAVGIDMPVDPPQLLAVAGRSEMTTPCPVVTISVRSAFFQTNGVIQDDFSGKPVPDRGVRHSSSPVFASSAVMYESAPRCRAAGRRGRRATIGDEAVPKSR